MTPDAWASFRGKRVLLLQGPVGPFFSRLAKHLRASGAQIYKVNFNGGDCLFYARNAFWWRGGMDQWPAYFEALLERLRVDIVLLFGDCRPIHRVARQIAHRHSVQVGAFEEGYVRPNFITFERFGVNGYSLVPRQPRFYQELPHPPAVSERQVGNTFWWAALWAVLYYVAAGICHPLFRGYRHHRPLTILEILPWIRGAWRKQVYRWIERDVLHLLTADLSRKFYLVPLQMSIDSQVHEHSRFTSMTDFIRHVIRSFAAQAPRETALVIKHHPLDRGYHDYAELIRKLTDEHGLRGRLFYIHDQHLPTLFDHMRGAVVINSTVGFSALTHGSPLKTVGVALYDLEGLTFQGSLDDFWNAADTFRPDSELLSRFRSYLIRQTQINGSFYTGPFGASGSASLVSVTDALRKTSVPTMQELEEELHQSHAVAVLSVDQGTAAQSIGPAS